MKNLAQLYSLSICFVSTLIILVTSILLFSSIINLTFYEFRNKYHVDKYINNEAYLNSLNEYDRSEINNLTPDQLTQLRISKNTANVVYEKHKLFNNIVDYLIYIFVSLIFSLIHFRMYKKTSKRIEAEISNA